jgi:hypothetical protein
MTIPIVFVSHPFAGDMRKLTSVEIWCAWLSMNLDALFVAPYVPLCRHWVDSGVTRERGMMLDLVAVARCDGLIAVGGPMSATGGRREFDASKNHYDCSEFETPEELKADSDGHTFDMLRGWVRELSR